MDLFAKAYQYQDADRVKQAGLYPYFKANEARVDTTVVMDGRQTVMVGSNNYLGLTSHPEVLEAARRAVDKYGSGCTGSRFLNGTIDLHVELERRLAKFMRKEDALVFSTGFTTNQGIISTLVSKGDVVISDRTNHASILDGCRLAYGKLIKFRHNDMEDLERILKNLAERDVGKLIVVDGVFSMEGDVADLKRIVPLARKYGARLMVDEAHGVGVLGKRGRGACEELGVLDQVDLVMGTFSKSFASLGGFVAGEERVINFLKHNARAFIFQAAPPPWRPWTSSSASPSAWTGCGRTWRTCSSTYVPWASAPGPPSRRSFRLSWGTTSRPSSSRRCSPRRGSTSIRWSRRPCRRTCPACAPPTRPRTRGRNWTTSWRS